MSQADPPPSFDELFDGTAGFPSGVGDSAAGEVPPVAAPPSEQAAPVKPPKPSLRERLRAIDIFTVMLGLSLLALIIAVVALAIELSRYKWDTSARSARQAVWGNRPIPVEVSRLA